MVNRETSYVPRAVASTSALRFFFRSRSSALVLINYFTWWVIGPLRWLIYLLKRSDNKRTLLAGRQRFGVNIGFSGRDGVMEFSIENLYVFKRWETEKTYKEFPSKRLGLRGLKTFEKAARNWQGRIQGPMPSAKYQNCHVSTFEIAGSLFAVDSQRVRSSTVWEMVN